MAASLTIVITGSNETIAQLNDRLQLANVGRHSLCNLLIDYMARVAISGESPGTMQVTTTDVPPTVSTSGAGSLQVTKSI